MAVQEPVQNEVKSDSLMLMIVAMVLVSLIAIAAGWFASTQLGSDEVVDAKEKANAHLEKKGDEDKEQAEGKESKSFFKSEKEVIELDTILVALSGRDKVWLRMQLAVVATDEADLDIAEVKSRMVSDITALVQTLTLAQISGPSGFIHLKEDLLDRARLTTDGGVEDLLIMSIVAE